MRERMTKTLQGIIELNTRIRILISPYEDIYQVDVWGDGTEEGATGSGDTLEKAMSSALDVWKWRYER
jgi:hypothetical protein